LRLCTFRLRREPERSARVGIVKEDGVFELKESIDAFRYLQRADKSRPRISEKKHPLSSVILLPPVPHPGKILATIVNTEGMLGGSDVTLDRPRLDMKAGNTVIGPGEKIVASATGIRPEVELAAVIGRRLKSVGLKEAKKGIFGYTILNDVTAPGDSKEDAYEAYRRDKVSGVIKKTLLRGPLFRSKNHDTFCPMGPWLVSSDELEGTNNLEMKTTFGKTTVQSGNTREYIFKPWEIASYVSGFLTLEPGDIVSCGSVGWTAEALGELDPTEYILPKGRGVLELEIEGIGKLSNPVVPV
jgi:2,4-didehydro-3-deoxy-L-rhamnonate hydrolase